MQCVITLSFSILVNGGKTKQFHPSQGLRQGDPLSPYLFIICQEVLYRLIENKLALGNISGVRINVSDQIITHVMFADHLMLFANALKHITFGLGKRLTERNRGSFSLNWFRMTQRDG